MPTTVKLYLRKDKQKPDGSLPLYIHVTKDRRRKKISLGIDVIPGVTWDVDKQQVTRKYPNSSRVNKYIAAKVSEAHDLAVQYDTTNDPVRNMPLKEKVLGIAPESFLQYADRVIAILKKSKEYGTAERYEVTINKLRKHLQQKELYFDQVTVEFLVDFEAYLKSLGNKVNTIHSNLKTIRAILYRAIRENKFPQEKNPFFKFKLKTAATKKDRLTKEEIRKIEELELDPTLAIYHARNLFLFAFYCAGIRVGDILKLKWSNINDNILSYQMTKTGSHRQIPLHKKAIDLLSNYECTDIDHYIFPFFRNDIKYSELMLNKEKKNKTAWINKKLSVVAKRAGISKKLTSHVARHSFADIARQNQASIYDISQALGHSSIAITERYLKSLNMGSYETVFDKVFD